jgi:hypothetical protein
VVLTGRVSAPISIGTNEDGDYLLLLVNPIPECKSRPPEGVLCMIAFLVYPPRVNLLDWIEGGDIMIELDNGEEVGGNTLIVVEGTMIGQISDRPCGIRLESAYLP